MERTNSDSDGGTERRAIVNELVTRDELERRLAKQRREHKQELSRLHRGRKAL